MIPCQLVALDKIAPPNEPSAETPEQVAEPERAVEEEAGMSDCAIEGEDQGSWMDLVEAAP